MSQKLKTNEYRIGNKLNTKKTIKNGVIYKYAYLFLFLDFKISLPPYLSSFCLKCTFFYLFSYVWLCCLSVPISYTISSAIVIYNQTFLIIDCFSYIYLKQSRVSAIFLLQFCVISTKTNQIRQIYVPFSP